MKIYITDKIRKRFFKHVKKSKKCWRWIGSKNPKGYATFFLKRSYPLNAHRLSWTIHKGKIPQGLQVCHKCDFRECTKPSHLFLGTQSDNLRDMVRKGRHVPTAKLTKKQVIKIRNEYEKNKITQSSLAEKYKITFQNVHCIVRRKSWKTI